jgi:site-specific DNA recombinase
MRVAAYLRMSNEKQATSIRDQRSAVQAYCQKHGMIVVAEYIDEAISGDDTERRAAFQRMISHASRGGFQAIIVWDLSRLGRFDMLEAGFWLLPLRNAGVSVITLDKGKIAWEDFAGRIAWGVEQEGKHAFLRDLARNVVRGKTAHAKEGDFCGGKPPLGYATDGGKFVLGPADDVAIVRRIFACCVSGYTLRGTAELLNAQGMKSPTGLLWSPHTIRAILVNRAYLGEYRWGHRQTGKYTRPDAITRENNHPPIIDVATFEAVQRILPARKTATSKSRNGEKYLLTGIIGCGHCGHRMSASGRGDSGMRYMCRKDLGWESLPCGSNSVSQSEVVAEILGFISSQMTDAMERQFRDEATRQLRSMATPQFADISRKAVAELNRRIQQAEIRLLECDADMLPTVQRHLRELRQQRESAEKSLRESSRSEREIAAEVSRAVDAAMEVSRRLKDAAEWSDPLRIKELLRETAEAVTVWSACEQRGRRRAFTLRRIAVRLTPYVACSLLITS